MTIGPSATRSASSSSTARLGQGHTVEREARRVREARGLCATRFAKLARQAHSRSTVSRRPAPHRTRSLRQSKLCQERSELGAARDRQAQRLAQRRRSSSVPATLGLTRRRRPLRRQRCTQRTHEPAGATPVSQVTSVRCPSPPNRARVPRLLVFSSSVLLVFCASVLLVF